MKNRSILRWLAAAAMALLLTSGSALSFSTVFKGNIFEPGHLKPRDSQLKVQAGDQAPEFELISIDGSRVKLSDFRGRNNVMISFIPAAWTPVCSDQWPGYNLAKPIFEAHHTIVLGISVDSRATLFSWTHQMGDLWFPVLSDFWPHGAVADKFGVLRSDGVAERALIFIDSKGVITHIYVSDINKRPPLELIVEQLDRMTDTK